MPPVNKTLGVGAVVSIQVRFLHPNNRISVLLPNMQPSERISDFLVLKLEERVIRKKTQLCIVLKHPSIDEEVWSLPGVVRVDTGAVAAQRFSFQPSPADATAISTNACATTDTNATSVAATEPVTATVEDDVIDLDNLPPNMIDDDNASLPDNIPDSTTTSLQTIWGHDGIDARKTDPNIRNMSARLVGFENAEFADEARIFAHLLPTDFIKSTILPETSKRLADNQIGPQHELSYGEFLRWLGLWLLMGTVGVDDRSSFWSREPSSPFSTPFRLNEYMSRNRFDAIGEIKELI